MTTIKQLISSPVLNNEKYKAVAALVFIGNMIDYNNNKITAKFNLSLPQFNVLRILGREYPKPVGIGFLRKAMVYKMSDVSRIVARLQKSGLLTRLTNDKDKRAADVVITTKGQHVLQQMVKYESELFKATSSLTVHEAGILNALLDKIAEVVMSEE